MPTAPPDIRVLVVDFRNGETVHQYPTVHPLIERGWEIRRCAPRLMEGRGLQLLVVLERLKYTPPSGTSGAA